MEFHLSRLRRGEWIVGGGAVVLAVAMFLLPWYGLKGPLGPTAATLGSATSWDGWNGLTNVRWLVLITILVGLALPWLQATRRAPALPVTFGVIVTVVSLVTTVTLIYRVLIDIPGASSVIERKAGGFIGLVASLAILCGGYLSIREEGLAPADEWTEIERVSLPGAGTAVGVGAGATTAAGAALGVPKPAPDS